MTYKSSDQLLESLSALVDNEASELEVRRILKNVESNPEVRERWHRYNMIGAVLRKETNINLGGTVDLTQGISAALAKESAFDLQNSSQAQAEALTPGAQEASTRKKGMLDFIAKSAVAASFAGALVLGFNMFGSGGAANFEGSSSQMTAATTGQRAPTDPGVTTAPLGFDLPRVESRTVSNNIAGQPVGAMRAQAAPPQADDLTDVATQNLLNELLIHHSARASSNGSLGIMPFARVSQMQPAEASK